LDMAEDGQLGEGVHPEMASLGALAAVVEAHMPSLVSSGIDGSFGLLPDQAAALGSNDDSVEKSIETPFFKRRL
jgi:hypothetical protein